ncbi:glucan endo-1,3-beta-glucosidase 9-like [Chenopodium quinoa]|uniref:glucan endo-1,3-beta-D-glucosidase n=1 Tax=Chenopodium quinoa TaxID=63459 RepID=A0A803KS82_CHEQI|nr:glucan endo-1,3-beta-glucosidase 9-like [Chenopodium quinoa]
MALLHYNQNYLGFVAKLLLIATLAVGVEAIGVNWGRNASHPLPPTKVVQLLKYNNITKVRLFEADPFVLQALQGSKIEVILGIPNSMLPRLNSSLKVAQSWVHDNLTRFLSDSSPKVRIQYIAVGDSPFLQSYGGQYVPYVVGASMNIQAALTRANIADQVKVVVPCSYDAFQTESGLPSKGHFRPDLNKTMIQLLAFLSKHNSPFMSSISPFHLFQQNKNISLHFSLFKETSHPHKDGKKVYDNSFDLSYDTLVTAISGAGFPQMDIIIDQIGWPTDGVVNSNSSTAESFMKGLLSHLRKKSGTPLRPHKPPKEAYILSLLDEDQKSIVDGGFERHWGIFTFDGQAKYSVDFGQGSRSLVNAQNVEYLSAKWCVVNDNKDLSNVTASALDACSNADCSALSPGGSCYNLTWPGNISYAFNSYYQQHDQSPDGCEFGGLGLVTTVDPSVDNCRFSVQLQTAYGGFLQVPSSMYLILLYTAGFLI